MQTVRSLDGTTIAFDRSGQGPALILVSGATSTRANLSDFAATLAPDFTVFAYDRRGRGDSGDTLPYAAAREVEDIQALIDASGGTAFVFGHSSGAVLALEAARLLNAKIRKLAVYEPPFIIDDCRPAARPDWLEQTKALLAAGRPGDALELFQTQVGMPAEMVKQFRQSPMWPPLEAVAPTLVYDLTIMEGTQAGSPLPLRKWAGVTVPTLVMDGTTFLGSAESHAWMQHAADAIARVLPHAQRRTLEGQDHGAAADVLAAALKEYFIA
jgi:pimeloyl-ACP methyl ester carboxylesterase